VKEEAKDQGFELASIEPASILGEDFAEHARRVCLVIVIALIWIGFSPRQGVSQDKTGLHASQPVSEGLRDETATNPLANRLLLFPVKGVRPDEIQDSFSEERSGGRRHEAIDILAERSTPVVAVESGTVAKTYYSQQGGLSVYQYDPSGRYVYYYAHLDRYAPGLVEGKHIRQGDLIGYVGQTGNAETPHLHFAISLLGSDQRWWQGKAINPYPLLLRARS